MPLTSRSAVESPRRFVASNSDSVDRVLVSREFTIVRLECHRHRPAGRRKLKRALIIIHHSGTENYKEKQNNFDKSSPAQLDQIHEQRQTKATDSERESQL
ncbi:hypothetical protein QYF36_005234 [Acer negundo]|nr:hypothetical protein QYF36_005234 [Acer negundo]